MNRDRASCAPGAHPASSHVGDHAQADRHRACCHGCAVCHVASITTSPAGTVINGGAYTVPPAIGDKIIHPFGGYLLHDVGTGDGIVQDGGRGTRNRVRTAALRGIRVRTRLMHDGASVSVTGAIQRHANQAAAARNDFNALSAANQANVLAFVSSL